MAELRQTFRPEFLNRIDDIIVFRALTEQDIEEVTRRMLKTVAGRMEAMDIHLDASDEAVKELAKWICPAWSISKWYPCGLGRAFPFSNAHSVYSGEDAPHFR